jgi:hypothetical protein
LGNVEEFIRANERLWEIIESHRREIPSAVKAHGYMYELVSSVFRASAAFLRELVSRAPSLSHLPKASLLGLHALMYQGMELVARLMREDHTWEEKHLADAFGLSVEGLRECMFETFQLCAMHMGRPTWWKHYRERCSAYWKRGAILPHLGALLLSVSDNPPEPAPRLICSNALVPWILGVIRDMSTGSVGAGAIGVVGASIGRGKTTTLYYTLRSAIYSIAPELSPEELDRLVSSLMLLDAEDFIEALEALAEAGVKAPVLVVDNASVLFPKQWASFGGEVRRFFLRMNTVIDLLRGVCGAVIFVANAPGELASFVRNVATINISGREEPGIKTYSVTVFTWKRPTLRVREGEEAVRMKERIASVYVYPLLKLPQELYSRDLRVKVEVIKRTLRERRKEEKGGAEEAVSGVNS